jgi:hypothetical protein
VIHNVIGKSPVTAPFAIAVSMFDIDLSFGCPVQGHLNLLYYAGVRLK